MATDTFHFAVAILITGRQSHALILDGGRQRRAVTPKSTILAIGTKPTPWIGSRAPREQSLFRLGPEDGIDAGQVFPRVERVGHGLKIPRFRPGHMARMAMSADGIGQSHRQATGIHNRMIAFTMPAQ